MKIALISTPTRTYVPNYIVPSGIMQIAAYLREIGHTVSIIDAAALREPNEKIAQRAKDFQPDIIGLGAIITAYAQVIEMTHAIKKVLPDIPIVLGGQIAINNADLCFKHMAIDFIVHGYGEIAMEKLVRHLQGELELHEIPGISYRSAGKIIDNPGREFFKKFDDMPFPAYDLVDMEHYATINGHRFAKLQKYLDKTGKTVKNHRFCTVMGTLGCTDRCTFCVHEQEFVGLKLHSNEYLIRHMEFLNKKYDIHVFSIGEEMFLTSVARAREFNRMLKERLPHVFWCASTRGNHVTPELIAELETGNCFYIAWGFESGSQRMLDLMKKRMTRKANIDAYYNLDHSQIVASASLMVGNVGEDNQSIKDTASAIKEAGIYSASAFFASPYPGGRTWDWAVEKGIIQDRHEYLMRASNKDAATRINCNLTPYPAFVLIAWQKMLNYACWQVEKKNTFRLGRKWPWKQKVKMWLKMMFGCYGVPTILLPGILDIYFFIRKIRKAIITTEKDKRFSYKVDSAGAILPEKLLVTEHQRFIPDEKMTKLIAAMKEKQQQALAKTGEKAPTEQTPA